MSKFGLDNQYNIATLNTPYFSSFMPDKKFLFAAVRGAVK